MLGVPFLGGIVLGVDVSGGRSFLCFFELAGCLAWHFESLLLLNLKLWIALSFYLTGTFFFARH